MGWLAEPDGSALPPSGGLSGSTWWSSSQHCRIYLKSFTKRRIDGAGPVKSSSGSPFPYAPTKSLLSSCRSLLFQVFGQVFVMTGGGIWEHAIACMSRVSLLRMGYASQLYVLFFIMFMLTIVNGGNGKKGAVRDVGSETENVNWQESLVHWSCTL